MKTTRILLIVAAALLLATAAFHASGAAMVTGWLDGNRGDVLRVLWYTPVLDWSVVALIWLYAAFRGGGAMWAPVAIAALIPLGAAVMLSTAVGVGFPGIWMLAGAAVLALIGAFRLKAA